MHTLDGQQGNFTRRESGIFRENDFSIGRPPPPPSNADAIGFFFFFFFRHNPLMPRADFRHLLYTCFVDNNNNNNNNMGKKKNNRTWMTPLSRQRLISNPLGLLPRPSPLETTFPIRFLSPCPQPPYVFPSQPLHPVIISPSRSIKKRGGGDTSRFE